MTSLAASVRTPSVPDCSTSAPRPARTSPTTTVRPGTRCGATCLSCPCTTSTSRTATLLPPRTAAASGYWTISPTSGRSPQMSLARDRTCSHLRPRYAWPLRSEVAPEAAPRTTSLRSAQRSRLSTTKTNTVKSIGSSLTPATTRPEACASGTGSATPLKMRSP